MDWSHPLLIAFAVSLLPTVVAVLVYLKTRFVKQQVGNLRVEIDGRLTELLKITKLEAGSRGELKGAEDERKRTEDRQ